MPKIIISGCNGRMGQVVARMCRERGFEIAAGFDITGEQKDSFPVFADPAEFTGEADAVIDFSNPAAIDKLLTFCKSRKIPAVICTTGYSAEQLEQIKAASAEIPIFKSGNMSVGINLLTNLVRKAAAVLGENFDVEIVERHHRTKLDAPSGTAIMLADAAAEGLPHESEYVYERQSVRKLRDKKEIGISSVRGGTIVGEHEVIFAGTDEVVELKHTAYSREVFANGAVTAAAFIAEIKQPGMYDMQDALADVLNK
jgi:4-hydroxy-tetrahydrodipicolinate reductase